MKGFYRIWNVRKYYRPMGYHMRVKRYSRGRIRSCNIYRAVLAGFGKIETEAPEPQ